MKAETKVVPTVPTCIEIEALIARYYGIRQHIIVPNVSWGLGVHECDLLVVTKSNWATEIEIKVSKADLKKDATKKHSHKSNKIKALYFAIPDILEPCIDLIPTHAGIYIIRSKVTSLGYGDRWVEALRAPTPNKAARALTDREMADLGRLGCMRIWGLKNTVIGLRNDIKHLRKQIA